MAITPVLTDAKDRRAAIRAQAVEGLKQAFPMKIRDHLIELHDVKVHEKDFGPNEQKLALLRGDSLLEPVRGTMVLKAPDGKELERVKNFTLLHLPYFTERHTFVVDGNEYQVAHQIRMKPGVYTRQRANGELEATFNLAKGSNFRLSLDPKRGHPYMEYGTTMIPLYPVLRKLGVPHQDIANAWGSEVAQENASAFKGKEDTVLDKLYGKMVHPAKQTATTHDGKLDAIRQAYDVTVMDPEVNHATLGHPYAKVTPSAMVDAAKKLLKIYKGGEIVDDRDSLAFKTFHSVDDFVKERIMLDARGIAAKVKGRATSKTALRDLLPAAPFTTGIRSFITGSQLSAIPTQINPMEIIDQAMKVTSLGEGGISSERAIPMEARALHPTHMGILDPVRTPESFKAGVDIRVSTYTLRDEKGNLYSLLRDKDGHMVDVSAKEMASHTIAFPNQKKTGLIAAMKDGQVQHVDAKDVDYTIHHSSQLYSPTSNLLPLMESIQGNRATMGAKMQTQALPLVHREVPWVQAGTGPYATDPHGSYEHEMGKLICPTAPVSGKVVKIDSQYIYIDPHAKKHAEETRTCKWCENVATRKYGAEDNWIYTCDAHCENGLEDAAKMLGCTIDDPFVQGKTAADTLDAARLNKFTQRKPKQMLDEATLALVGRKPLGELGRYAVFLVNGQAVRENIDLDFVAGGNPSRYGYIPLGEIWIEGTVRELGANALHEFIEAESMLMTGMNYDKAHEAALNAEKLFRATHPDATVEDAKQWLGTMGMKTGAAKRQKTIQGVTFKIELEPGDERTGTNPETGEKWSKKMSVCYGYIPKTTGDDDENVDIYLKEDGNYTNVYVVHQKKKNGDYDEDKCMIGFETKEEAKAAYEKHGPEWGFGNMDEYSWDEFVDDYLEEHKKEAADKDLVRVPYDTNFPFASKTYLNHDVNVKEGDHVKADQVLADSNFTKDGTLALGKNMKVAYMAYYGRNANDAVVISEGAAQKLTSEHMYKEVLDLEPDTTVNRELHRQYFGTKYTAEQYNKLSESGVVRKGQKLIPHDPIIVGVVKGKMSATDALLGNLKKTLANPYREQVRVWEHDSEGEVIDVFQAPKRIVVTIRTREPMRIGDKLSNRFGGKGVVSHIVPDEKMVKDESGKPIDILYTPAGIVSRINPAAVIESALGKVVEKTGKPIITESFSGKNNVQWARDLLKQHGLKDKETVFDPISGKHIPGIAVGHQYTLRLFKTTDVNFAARGTGGYDVNQQPTKGGTEGAKAIGRMEFNALVAHNARNVLRETATVKSQKSDEFWRAVQLGLPLPALRPSFSYDKYIAMLQASGVNVEKQGHSVTMKPLTDRDVLKMSSGVIENEKLVRAKDLMPERGGFFDPGTTGGTTGTNWTHVELAEPVVNPVFVEPARRLLGLTNKEFEKLHYESGGAAVKRKLNAIDVNDKLKQLHADLNKLTGSKLDDAVKQVKYLEALKKQNLKIGDAYVMSKLPVLPPIMRPVLPGKGGQELVVGDSNYLYQNAFLHNKTLQAQVTNPILPPDEHANLRKNLFRAVGAVIGTHETDNPKLQKRNVKGFIEHLTGKTTPKSSFFQKKLVKRQQDLSGRGTIAPDGTLGIDQIGIPEEMLWGMFGKFVVARLIRRGFGAVQANDMLEKRHPAAKDALLAEIHERPVMVNRAPTLHRYNIVGAYAVPTAGKTILLNPFIEKGMNADYDGDTMQVHVPVMAGAVEDVKRMTLSQLVLGDKNRNELMAVPGHESLIGIYWATKKAAPGAKVHKFKTTADAMAAYHKGELKIDDLVEIGGAK